MANGDAWRRMVLTASPPPAWLAADAPSGDVVLSTRFRLARNLVGFRFVHAAPDAELRHTMELVLAAAREADLGFEVYKGLTHAERDHLVATRLVSADYEWTLPGRALLIDPDRTVSVMVNEEDHLRVQALVAGWSPGLAESAARRCLARLGGSLEFAFAPEWGYLTASPTNLGAGKRHSAMLHLIGLAGTERLPNIMVALGEEGIVVRGLFGEASRAVGAFAQVSATGGSVETFAGAVEYLVREERAARGAMGTGLLAERAEAARDYAVGSRKLGLGDALRVLGWLRWAAVEGEGPFGPRDVDAALATLEIRGGLAEDEAARGRAGRLRRLVGR